jgi:hypothetical protein
MAVMKFSTSPSMLRLLPLLLLGLSVPVAAEQLHFDHRLYPPLKAIFDNKRQDMIHFDDKNPNYVVDRIAIQGTSADVWTEALDIIARTPSEDVKNANDWFAEIRAKAEKACPSQFEEIARDDSSVTFSRRSTNCGPDKVQFALYRIVTGKRSLFLLNAITRGDMDGAVREKWLQLLGSARLEN